MAPHIALAAFLYLISLTPWCYLNCKLTGWSAFRIFAIWSLIRVALLVPLVWIDFGLYSQLAWPCRAVTVGLMLWVCGWLWGRSRGIAPLAVTGAALTLLWPLPTYWIAELVIAGACGLCLLGSRKTARNRTFAIGLLVYTLFPVISERQFVMEYGGWLRLVPVLSGLMAQIIWIRGLSARPAARRAHA